MKKIRNFLGQLEDRPVAFGLWLSTALAIIFLRDALETIATDRAFPFIHPFHLVHVPVFFFSVLVTFIVVLHFFSKVDIIKVSRLCLFFFPIILLPPCLDLLFPGHPAPYAYIEEHVWQNFIHFFDPSFEMIALPASVRIEVALIVLGSCAYIFLNRKSLFWSLAGGLAVYCAVFSFVAIPGLFVSGCIVLIPLLSRAVHWINALFHRVPLPYVREGAMEDANLLIVELLFGVIALGLWFWRYDRVKARAAFQNMRIGRSVHYAIMGLLGLSVYLLRNEVTDLFAPIKALGMLAAVFFAFQFSVVTNDLVDVGCDEISNKTRPLVSGIFKAEEYLRLGLVYLALSLLFALWVGDYCFGGTILFIVLYFLYSMPPLRLKRVFLLSSVIIGLEAVVAFLLGQVCLDEKGTLNFIDMPLWLALFLAFFLASHVKDLKDIEGDRRCGIPTLPVLLGKARACKVIGCLVFASYILIGLCVWLHPEFGGSWVLGGLAACFGAFNLIYLWRGKAEEKTIFVSYFLFAGFLLLFFGR